MQHYVICVVGQFDEHIFSSSDVFMEQDIDFVSLSLKNEKELNLLFEMLGINPVKVYESYSNNGFDLVYDLTGSKIPRINSEKLNAFRKKWVYLSGRDSSSDALDSIDKLLNNADKWNKIGGLVVARERSA